MSIGFYALDRFILRPGREQHVISVILDYEVGDRVSHLAPLGPRLNINDRHQSFSSEGKADLARPRNGYHTNPLRPELRQDDGQDPCLPGWHAGGAAGVRSTHGDDERAVPMTFLWVYLPGMATIDHLGQPELPIGQRIACRRCKGSGAVYYARISAEIIGGKRIQCPECGGIGSLDLADQLFRYDIVSHEKKRRVNRRKSAGQQLELP